MRIVFALPAYTPFPVGGYHVHYHYASMLAARGHDVTIVFPRYANGPDTLRARVGALQWELDLRRRHRPLIRSYPIDPRVKVRLLRNLGAAMPDADVLIATAWQTAEALGAAPARCGRKFYIVYDYEHLMTSGDETAARIKATYRLPFAQIATSGIVAQTIRAAGGSPVANIACGLDFTQFGIDVAPAQRGRLSVGFPVRHEAFKGTQDAVAAMGILRARYGDALRVTAFGSQRTDLPDWIDWLDYPDQAALRGFYNRQSVFVVPSHFEGWGLPGIEAMTCGAALVTTDNGGCLDYAIDGETALVVPPRTPEALAAGVARLFDDDALRLRLAQSGAAFARRFTWERAIDALEPVLTGAMTLEHPSICT